MKNQIDKMTTKQKYTYQSLNRHTRSERNNYYGKVVAWEIRQLEKIINTVPGSQGRYGIQQYHIESAKGKLAERHLLTLTWLKEAEEFFNTKLMVMVQKLEGFGFLQDNVILDYSTMDVTTDGTLEFWIEARDRNNYQSLGRVYARLVPVDGYEKRFHYRFVTTLKGAPKKVEVKEVAQEEKVATSNLTGRKAQVAELLNENKTAQQIADELESNVSYIRTIIRGLRK